VRIYLPRSRENEDAKVELGASPVIGGAETILLVEDDEDVRVATAEMLSELGYSVLKAKDADSALVIIERKIPIAVVARREARRPPCHAPGEAGNEASGATGRQLP
jgi:PleD family two-component response regulator